MVTGFCADCTKMRKIAKNAKKVVDRTGKVW